METDRSKNKVTQIPADVNELPRSTPAEYALVYQWANEQGLIKESDTALYFYNLDLLDNRLEHLREVFPEHTMHAIAIKTNPLLAVLRHMLRRGFSLEAASMEEVYLARMAGAKNGQIIFDSPVKTPRELAACNSDFPGMYLNANAIEELRMIPGDTDLKVGLRINPLVDSGAPDIFHVSGKSSKFGVPITRRDAIIHACLEYPFLQGLHMHIGSDMSQLNATARAVKVLEELAEEIVEARKKRNIQQPIRFIDIGGGFPARYGSGPQEGLEAFVGHIHGECPSLFERYQVLTEFGRFIHAHCGWVLSDVEYVLEYEQPAIAMLHVGADLFLREIYQEDSPHHAVYALDPRGNLKTGPKRTYHLGGPLCFASDYLGRDRRLPELNPGDKVVIADAGANSIGMWSRHCSRSVPKVIAYSLREERIVEIKKRESTKETLSFWQ